jgi:hypothetical protein
VLGRGWDVVWWNAELMERTMNAEPHGPPTDPEASASRSAALQAWMAQATR